MKKKLAKKKTSKPVSKPQTGTSVLGTVIVPYVQFDVSPSMASEVAKAVAQVMSDELHIQRLRASGMFGNNDSDQ